MTRSRCDGPDVVPMDEVSPEAVGGLLADCGRSRYLVEVPFLGDQRERYLLGQILRDSGTEDAVAWAAVAGDTVVGLAVVRFPAWDLAHFGFPVARIEHLQGIDRAVLTCLAERCIGELSGRSATTCSARVYGDALGTIHCLEEHGFRFQETVLNPWRDLASWQRTGVGATRPAEDADLPAMMRIAGRAFRTDRFHRDSRFSGEAADSLYADWVSTWHAERRSGRFSRVLQVGSKVIGFFLFELLYPHGPNGEAVASLVLNAVDPDESGRGYGYRMYCDVLDTVSPRARYATSTVAAVNGAVIHLYLKLGFRLTGSGEVTLHWWREGQGGSGECAYS